MDDIVINGVSLTELKALQDKVTPGAMKFIAEHIEAGKEILGDMRKLAHVDNVTDNDRAYLETRTKEALAHFQVADLVAGITGMQYDMYDYGLWFLEDAQIDIEKGVFGELSELLYEMHRNTQYWNASIC